MERQRQYVTIDLKFFYASVECIERGLDPMTTNLVVADASRSAKTICLAVFPSLKAYGISGRARLFEVVQRVWEVNNERKWKSRSRALAGESYDDTVLKQAPDMAVSYIAAVPRMALYIEYRTRIYNVYLKYIAPEDIHVYSIDEVFIDVTDYLNTYKMTAHELAKQMIQERLNEHIEIEITYYEPDENNAGGTIRTVRGIAKKLMHIKKNLSCMMEYASG